MGIIDVLFPLVAWLIEGFEETPVKQQVNDDRWYTKPAHLFFYQKDIIDGDMMGILIGI